MNLNISESRAYLFFKTLFIYFQREGKRARKRGRGTSMCKRNMDRLPLTRPQLGTWPATQACALTGNHTSNLSVHRPSLSSLSHTSQVWAYLVIIVHSLAGEPRRKELQRVVCFSRIIPIYISCPLLIHSGNFLDLTSQKFTNLK